MRTAVFARSEQPQTPLEIMRAALRAAALSERPNDAIDVLVDALVCVAAIVEARHA